MKVIMGVGALMKLQNILEFAEGDFTLFLVNRGRFGNQLAFLTKPIIFFGSQSIFSSIIIPFVISNYNIASFL